MDTAVSVRPPKVVTEPKSNTAKKSFSRKKRTPEPIRLEVVYEQGDKSRMEHAIFMLACMMRDSIIKHTLRLALRNLNQKYDGRDCVFTQSRPSF